MQKKGCSVAYASSGSMGKASKYSWPTQRPGIGSGFRILGDSPLP